MSVAQTHWRFINSGFQSGAENMQIDEALAFSLQRNEILPTLRVYGWKPWAISLGHHQREEDINKIKCAEQGIDIVRRATGGRAILHANELTYSIVMFAAQRGIHDVYSQISRALASGLQLLGAEIDFVQHQPDFTSLYKLQSAMPCFSSSARFEILHNGKKLVGSAQRRFTSIEYPEVVLQHGSILIGDEHLQLTDLLNISDDSVLKNLGKKLREKTTTVNSILHRHVSYDEVAIVIKTGFEETMNIVFTNTLETIL